MDEKETVRQIQQKLTDIEKTENVKILFAVESGSRAWGFASPDSDFDVRFVYKRNAEFYLRIDRRRDVIEFTPDEVFDINGWDLDKTLRLLHSSNPTLFEWVNSPIVYRTSAFHEKFKKLVPAYFHCSSGLNHYLAMAAGNYREYLKGNEVRLKKYFYTIRPLLACRWIVQNNSAPPMVFTDLVEACLEKEMQSQIDALLQWKMSATESQYGSRIDALNIWIETNLATLRADIAQLPHLEKKNWQELNEFFLQELSC